MKASSSTFGISRDVVADTIAGAIRVYQKTNRIISGDNSVVVKVENPTNGMNNIAGWAVDKTISFNNDKLTADFRRCLADRSMGNMTGWNKLLMAMTGLNYHELGHVLYTPERMGVVRVWQDRTHAQAWNIMEDQRIEMMFWAKYLPTQPYFTYMVINWVIGASEKITYKDMASSYPFIAHRLYLPKSFRDSVRSAYIDYVDERLGKPAGNELADEVDALLRKFITSQHHNSDKYSDDVSELEATIRRFAVILNQFTDNNGSMLDGAPLGVGSSNEDHDDDYDEMTDLIDEIDTEEDNEDNGDNGGSGDNEDDGDDGGSGDNEGNGDDGDDGVNVDSGASGGNGDNVIGELQDLLNDAITDTDVVSDLEYTTKAVAQAVEDNEYIADSTLMVQSTLVLAPSKARTSVERMVQEMRFLRDGLEDHWVDDERTGTLDIRKVIRRKAIPGPMDVFKTWEPSHEAAGGVETVICLDVSLSMAGELEAASQIAAWQLKRMHDEIDQPCTVLTYGSSVKMLFSSDDVANRSSVKRCNARGSTTLVCGVLAEAALVFSKSSAPNKILVVITDGDWVDGLAADEIVSNLNVDGATTVLVQIGDAPTDRHNCQVVKYFKDPTDLVPMVKDLVANVTRRALTQQ